MDNWVHILIGFLIGAICTIVALAIVSKSK